MSNQVVEDTYVHINNVRARVAAGKSLPPATARQARALRETSGNFASLPSSYSMGSLASLPKRYRLREGARTARWAIRPPCAEEEAASLSLQRELETLMIGGRRSTRVRSDMPPGRIDTRRMIDWQMSLRSGKTPHSKPFTQMRHAEVQRTLINAGFVIDVSGSMEEHAALGSSISWVIHHAILRLRGQVTMVGFSNHLHPWVAPGEPLPGVLHTGTSAGSHHMHQAIAMVDAAANLLDSDGARLLFVFSDNGFHVSESKSLPLLANAGVQIVWVAPDDLSGFSKPRRNFTAITNARSMRYSELVNAIGSSLKETVQRERGLV